MTHHRVVIVGTGFSGIGMAIRLLEEGERDFVVLERAGEIGGTWRDNTYYIDRNGHNSTIWPTFTWPFRRRTRQFDEAAYALGSPTPAPVAAAA